MSDEGNRQAATDPQADLISEIKSRGYWQVVIRPVDFSADLLARNELVPLVNNCRVELRGWDFPHFDRQENSLIDLAWCGQGTRWEHFREIWRMYRSGQFISLSGIPYDWRDMSTWWPPTKGWQPNAVLGTIEVVARLTEICEFASRLSQSKAGAGSMKIRIALGRMRGRRLTVDSPTRTPLSMAFTASVEIIPIEKLVSRVELVQDAGAIAITLAEEVYSFFGWTPAPNTTADFQREFLKGR